MSINASDDAATVASKLRQFLPPGVAERVDWDSDLAGFLTGKTIIQLQDAGRLYEYVQSAQLPAHVAALVTSALQKSLESAISPSRTVSDISSSSSPPPSSSGLSREDRLVSPKKRPRDDGGRRESFGAQQALTTSLEFSSFDVGVFPVTAGASLDDGTGLSQKI